MPEIHTNPIMANKASFCHPDHDPCGYEIMCNKPGDHDRALSQKYKSSKIV